MEIITKKDKIHRTPSYEPKHVNQIWDSNQPQTHHLKLKLMEFLLVLHKMQSENTDEENAEKKWFFFSILDRWDRG